MAEPESDSIFELGDVFDYRSPFGSNWVQDQKEARQRRQLTQERDVRVLVVNGPFDEQGKKVDTVSRDHSYTYVAHLNVPTTLENLAKVQWSVSYDEASESYTSLFTGGRMDKSSGGVAASIHVPEGRGYFRISAQIPSSASGYYNTTGNVYFKKTMTLFVGGAGDLKPFIGTDQNRTGPTNIMVKVQKAFAEMSDPLDSSSMLLGYDDVYALLEDKRKRYNIFDQYGQINTIGHSLGGWNGAHLTQKLNTDGYHIGLLTTLDPVGRGLIVRSASQMPMIPTSVRSEYWINIYANPELWEWDDDDWIAFGGEKWRPKSNGPLPQIDKEFDGHHREALKMFNYDVGEGLTASRFLQHFVDMYLGMK